MNKVGSFVKNYTARALFVLAFMFLGVYDTITSLMAAEYMGGFEAEISPILGPVGEALGPLGFAAVKLLGVLAAAGGALWLAEHHQYIRHTACTILGGSALGGALAGTGNLLGISGRPIIIAGDPAMYAYIIYVLVAGCFLCGALLDLLVPRKESLPPALPAAEADKPITLKPKGDIQ